MLPRTVKGIPRPDRKSDLTDAFVQQIYASELAADCRRPSIPNSVNRRAASATIDSPPRSSPHFRRVPAAVCSYAAAEAGCIGDVTAERLEVGTRPQEW